MENERFKRKVLTSLGGIIVCMLFEMIYYTLPVDYQTLQTYTLKVSILIFYIELVPIAWRFFTTFREMYRFSDAIPIYIALFLGNKLLRFAHKPTTPGIFMALSDFYFVWDDRVLMDRKVLVQNIVYVTVKERIDSDEHRDRQDDNGGDDEGDDEDEDDDDDEDEEEEEEDDDHENDDKDESEDEGKEADRRETRTRHHSSNDGSDSDGLNESGNNKLRRPANANSRTVQSSSSSSSSDADSSESEYVLPRSSRFGQRMQKFDKPSSSSGPSNEKTKVNNVKDSKSSKKQKSRQKNAPQSTSPALARSRNSSPLSSAAEKAEIIHGTSKASIRRTQRGKGRRDGMVFSAEIRQQQMDKNHRNSGKKPARGKGSRGGKVANQLRKEKEDRLSRARDEEANEDEEAEERRNLIAEKTKKTGSKKTKKAKELGKAETQDANPIAGRTRNAAATKTKEGNEVEEAEAPISERTRNAGTKEPKGQGKKKKNGGKGKKNGSKKKN
ncbi:hypothetical protein GCK72_011290 [Caenorhabditis remanei]|uniref:Uncharacterized protein n=1 Tax=Caenorhabditis remanei TaxID=31234 RepID=A0A6A5H7C8_CAERE|nr:hypothetical protein GCK72_011290 [Caenorhabditis remanei]KAF1763025.1 hypothetical protein GCK72_011290 [Caenorhabditis remanei]